jgi:hypothetical protein
LLMRCLALLVRLLLLIRLLPLVRLLLLRMLLVRRLLMLSLRLAAALVALCLLWRVISVRLLCFLLLFFTLRLRRGIPFLSCVFPALDCPLPLSCLSTLAGSWFGFCSCARTGEVVPRSRNRAAVPMISPGFICLRSFFSTSPSTFGTSVTLQPPCRAMGLRPV